jgi:hypothetical protein
MAHSATLRFAEAQNWLNKLLKDSLKLKMAQEATQKFPEAQSGSKQFQNLIWNFKFNRLLNKDEKLAQSIYKTRKTFRNSKQPPLQLRKLLAIPSKS